jgi:predicted O-linked N-acetylglucosamine transferase (SPINDLY family)
MKQAVQAFRRAVGLRPNDSLSWLNLAQALARDGDNEAAVDAALRSFEIDSASTITCQLAVEQLFELNRFDQAIAVMERLAPQAVRDKDYYANYGSALLKLGRPREAVDRLLKAVALELHFPLAHFRMGMAFKDLGMYVEAGECFRTAAALRPDYTEALEQALHQNMHACHWATLDDDIAAIVRAHAGGQVTSSVPFCLITLPVGPQSLLSSARCAIEPIRRHALRVRGRADGVAIPVWPGQARQRRLRVGYVSNDFRHHATSMLMVQMLECRNRERFDVLLYSHSGNDGSPLRCRIQKACEEFVEIDTLSDAQVADRIRADRIDILVDLKGLTSGQRLGIFALRPAPLQVGFLGYPGTVGSDFLDYFIGDPVTTPLEHAGHFTEKLAQMPVVYQPNDRSRPLPAPLARAEVGLPDDAFVMCSFNQSYKITPQVFDLWCSLLRDITGSVLWLLVGNDQARANLIREAQARGVDSHRLVFAPMLQIQRHLARLQAADLFVDTFPCSAHTTASDALWAGVPLVTMTGQTFPSRVAASLLHAVGLPELACADGQQYTRTIRELAADRGRLQGLREHLRRVRMQTPLFDSERFARDIEALYLRMAERAEVGLPPEHLLAATTA